MTPVVLIATHQRLAITSANILTLQLQTRVPVIVVVCTDPLEAEHYRDYEGVHVVEHANTPLGAKWQAGVDFARQLNPSHLVITGSDDILCKDFVERMCTPVAAFTGLQKWFVWSPTTGILYLFDYLAKQCLGGGRVYSRALLDANNWHLFSHAKSKWLDDRGWELATPGERRVVTDEGCILAVKGNWPVMNALSATLESKNARLVRQWGGEEARRLIEDKFNYTGL